MKYSSPMIWLWDITFFPTAAGGNFTVSEINIICIHTIHGGKERAIGNTMIWLEMCYLFAHVINDLIAQKWWREPEPLVNYERSSVTHSNIWHIHSGHPDLLHAWICLSNTSFSLVCTVCWFHSTSCSNETSWLHSHIRWLSLKYKRTWNKFAEYQLVELNHTYLLPMTYVIIK